MVGADIPQPVSVGAWVLCLITGSGEQPAIAIDTNKGSNRAVTNSGG